MPVWLWGILGGIILGFIGLLTLMPGCTRGFNALLTRFVLSAIIKLVVAGTGIIIAVKRLHFEPIPLVAGCFVGYLISLCIEIIPCIWKLRQCSNKAPSAG